MARKKITKTNRAFDDAQIIAALDQMAQDVSGQMILSACAAMAKVIYDEVKLNTSEPRMGKKTGNLHNSIYRVYKKESSTDSMKLYQISWNGGRDHAPHGKLLEFGTSRSPAYPFVRPAYDRIQDAINAGFERLREKWQEARRGNSQGVSDAD